MKNFILISKDAMCKDYLQVYNKNSILETPNINELAEKGTVFYNHYTAAPSTVMSFYSMCLGKYPFETNYQVYEQNHEYVSDKTIFQKIRDYGYDECHLVWDEMWDVLPKYFDYFHNDVQIHSLVGFRQGVGPHYIRTSPLIVDKKKERATFELLQNEVLSIFENNKNKNLFIWIHFPHVINGRISYGSDIDLFDQYVGFVRSIVPDDCISITADHGNMNGHKGKLGYGFDTDNTASCIPFITPRINNLREYNGNTSSVDLFNILFEKEIPSREFIYIDTAFRAQQHRKLAIVYKNFKYVFEKQNRIEKLFDLNWDPNEEFSLIDDLIYDIDRKLFYPIKEEYFYNNWEEINFIRSLLRNEKSKIWKEGDRLIEIKSYIKALLRPFYKKITRKHV